MTTYIVTFEIKDAVRKNKVKEKLKEFGSYCPINDNCWAIRSEKKAPEVRDFITTVMLSEDRIFIVRSGTEAAWRNSYGNEHSEWLKKHL